MHWSDAYIQAGLKYDSNFACADFAEKVRREVFGHDLHLPKSQCAEAFERGAMIALYLPNFAEQTAEPADGDGVLIVTRGRMQHIGIYCQIGSDAWVIHNVEIWNVTRTRVRDLARWQMAIEGFYKWIR